MKKKLMLVDDESEVIDSLKRVFRRESYDIVFANSGKDALDMLETEKVDVIISDQRMPHMSGSEFLSIVRKKYPDTIRIALSGYTDLDNVISAVNEGNIYKFFTKPWDNETLKNEIRSAFHHQELIQKNDVLSKIFDSTIEGIVVFDEEGIISATNPAFTKQLQFQEEEVQNKRLSVFKCGGNEEEFMSYIAPILKNNHEWHGELVAVRKDATEYPAWVAITELANTNPGDKNFAALFIDMSEQKKSEERVRYHAYHDILTGLGNKLLLQDDLQLSISQAKQKGWLCALLCIDIDRFKSINDAFGHDEGDQAICKVADILKSSKNNLSTLYRFGGDEFYILMPKLVNLSEVEIYAENIISELNTELCIHGQSVHLSASVGISIFPNDTSDVSELLKFASAAMYSAKKSGRKCYHFYSPSLNLSSKKKLELENMLHVAINENQFCLYYQPKRCVSSKEIEGFEALLRWPNPEKGMISPQQFIHLAEETGLIIPIGDWLIEESLQQLQSWMRQGYTEISIAVNVSAIQFEHESFLPNLEEKLMCYDIPAQNLHLELTENLLIENSPKTIEKLSALKELGFHLALDDFGTGYSSLSYLKNFPFDTLKIDQSFIRDITTHANNTAMVSAIISIAQSLHMSVVAEGVEYEEQWDILHKLQCDLIQGYFGGKPTDKATATDLLSNS